MPGLLVLTPKPMDPMRQRLFLVLPLLLAGLPGQSFHWTNLQSASQPPARFNHVLVYDSARQALVLHGGWGQLADTWEYDGTNWFLRATTGPAAADPNGGSDIAAAYDSQRQRTVLVRADNPSDTFQTWEWDGVAWLLRTTTASPPPRWDFAVAYDSNRGRIVLFGGRSGGLGNAGDTWEFDGAGWLQRGLGGAAPPGRGNHAMAYDDARQTVVLFGGNNDNVLFGDTWEWNGTTWSQYGGAVSPAARTSHAIAYDAARQRTVLYGGSTTGSGILPETWEWDGTTWSLIATTGRPSSDYAMALAYDSNLQRTVGFGGRITLNHTYSDELWAYAFFNGPAASFTAFGQGCAGPAGTPTLTASPGSLPHIGTSFVMTLANLPPTPFNLAFGIIGYDAQTWNGQPLPVSLDPFGFTGCQAWIAPVFTEFLVNAVGTATWEVELPFTPIGLGWSFYVQAGVLAPGWNPGAFVFSNAGHAVVGMP